MLCLSREPNESVIIDGQTVVTVLSVSGSRVKLGIQAPGSVRVLRDEIAAEELGESRVRRLLSHLTNAFRPQPRYPRLAHAG